MSNLKQLRSRIKSIKSTQKITKAMQMVAAARLRRVKNEAIKSLSYFELSQNLLNSISYEETIDLPTDIRQFFYIKNRRYRRVLLIICGSERGLCGGFNNTIIKAAKEDLAAFEKAGKIIKLIIIGKKVYEAFKNTKYARYIDSYFNVARDGTNDAVMCIKQRVMDMVLDRTVGSCYLYFNECTNAIKQTTNKKQILPINPSQERNKVDRNEMEGAGLVSNMVSSYLFGQINMALVQNKASEESARIIAMDTSTKNATELVNHLTLILNGTRQSIITRELIEIISGAEAL